MTEQDIPPREQTKAVLLERNRRAFEELEELLRPLDDAALTRPGPGGWAIKDHLAHLAAWLNGVTALLQRRSREEAMGLKSEVLLSRNEDEINAHIYRANAHLTAAQAWDMLRDAHRQITAQVESMDNEDLFRPYASFLPEGESGPQDPILYWIVGNAYEHYQEHAGWIREMLD